MIDYNYNVQQWPSPAAKWGDVTRRVPAAAKINTDTNPAIETLCESNGCQDHHLQYHNCNMQQEGCTK